MATIIIPAVTFGDIYIIYAKRILALDMKLFFTYYWEKGLEKEYEIEYLKRYFVRTLRFEI